MPTVLRWIGYRFYFFSNEGSEPPHIHVDKDEIARRRFWLADAALARNIGFSSREIGLISAKVREEREPFMEAWRDYFSR